MGKLNPFKAPKVPQVQYTPPPEPIATPVPTVDNSAADIAKAQAEDEKKRKQQKGRAATVLTKGSSGGSIFGDDQGVATRTLTGN